MRALGAWCLVARWLGGSVQVAHCSLAPTSQTFSCLSRLRPYLCFHTLPRPHPSHPPAAPSALHAADSNPNREHCHAALPAHFCRRCRHAPLLASLCLPRPLARRICCLFALFSNQASSRARLLLTSPVVSPATCQWTAETTYGLAEASAFPAAPAMCPCFPH